MTFAQIKARWNEVRKHYTVYFTAFCSLALAYWLQMSPEDQAAVFAVLPALKLVAPFAGFVGFMMLKWPRQ